ncbi:hypothetical protein V7128_12340 [Neobacillus vireti]|uniref:hypothetical protein n=1 Tax=Neobacillus vireti TaxID=220686 RepID=UPI002FFF66DE
MKGIYFINDSLCIDGKTNEESIVLQEQAIKEYLTDQNIQVSVLNPYQLKEYYTVPHALLYDLRKENMAFDYFVFYSLQAVQDFIYTYPAKWLILKSYFKEVIVIDKKTSSGQKKAI